MLDSHDAVEGGRGGSGATEEEEESGSAGEGGGSGGGGEREREGGSGGGGERGREGGLEAYLPTSPRASKRRIRRILQACPSLIQPYYSLNTVLVQP